MKFNSLLAIMMAGGFFFTSCAKDDAGKTEIPEGNTAIATVTLKNPDLSYATWDTPEEGSVAESKINMLEFYIFNSDGTADTKTAYHKVDSYNGGNVQFAVTDGTGKKFVVAVNMDLGTTGITNYASLQAKLAGKVLDETNSRSIPSTGMLMSGEVVEDISANVADNRVTLVINRLVTKFEAPTFTSMVIDLPQKDIDSLYGEGSSVTNADISFVFEGFTLCNGIDNSDVIFNGNASGIDTNPWDPAIWRRTGKNYHESDFTPAGDYTKVYSGDNGGSFFIDGNGTVFVYENLPTAIVSGGLTTYDREEVYAFIVKGTLKVSGESDIVRYWRVNLIKDDAYNILRNVIYRVNVNKILSKGYGTPKDAEEGGGTNPPGPGQTGVNIDMKVAPWRVRLSNTEM